MKIIEGFRGTFEILAMRWSMIKSPTVKALIVVVAILAAFAVYGSTNLGQIIRWISGASIASESTEALANIVVTYIKTFTTENSVFAISGVLGALIGSLVFVPLLGYSFSGLVPAGDLVSVRKNDYHLISDSIVLQFLSSISLVQILFITLLNSLLTISVMRPGFGIVLGWGLWLLVVLLTVLVAWTFEFLHRRYGAYSKYIVLGIFVIAAGIIYALNPHGAARLFGLADGYGNLIRAIDTFNWWQMLLTLGGYITILGGLLALISTMGSWTISLQERPKRKKSTSHMVLGRKRQNISQLRFLFNIVLHQRNIRRPLQFIAVSVLISVTLFGNGGQFLYFFAVVTPIFVALSWGVNVFGILGGGTIWLVSLPGSKPRLLASVAGVQFILILIIQTLILIPEIFIYHVDWAIILQFMLATVATSAYITRSALSKAVYQPERYRVHIRGEAVLPPVKALAYLGRFFAGAAFVDILMFGLGVNLLYAAGMMLLVIGWQLFRFKMLQNAWQNEPEIVENIIASVGY